MLISLNVTIRCAMCDKIIGRFDDYICCKGNCKLCLEKFQQLKGNENVQAWARKIKLKYLLTSGTPTVVESKYINEHFSNAIKEIINMVTKSYMQEVIKFKK